MRVCAVSKKSFAVREEEESFYDRISPVLFGQKYLIPLPTHCPEERQRRRAAFRNERAYYHRTCSRSGKKLISIYPPETEFPVYSAEVFWSDDWDALDFGCSFDFSRPFFEQFYRLQNRVPRLYFSSTNLENSEYCNHAGNMKNCYLIIGSLNSEGCLYGTRVIYCRDCVDCLWVDRCELCYECVNCERCYDVAYAFDCKDVHDSRWVRHCRSSHDLLFCLGVQQGCYQVLNKQLSREQFLSFKEELFQSPALMNDYESQFSKLLAQTPVPALVAYRTEDCTGNYLAECRSCFWLFDAQRCEDVRYGYDAVGVKNSMDVYSLYDAELCYEMYSGSMGMFHCLFTRDCWPGQELLYCDHCFNCASCLGCIGLRQKQYCVLNQQYSKAEYERLAGQIISKMAERGEWGEFFPTWSSQFPYNDTVAQEYYPLTEEQALARGYRWTKEREAVVEYTRIIDAVDLPLFASDYAGDLLGAAVRCAQTGKVFRLTKAELEFYQRLHLRLPRVHPDIRHLQRKAEKNPWHLWRAKCADTGAEIWSGYPPEQQKLVSST